MSRRRRRPSRRRQPAPAPASWDRAEARARSQLRASTEAIEATSRGTAGQPATTWRRGTSPGATA